jgi:hypothetical protein
MTDGPARLRVVGGTDAEPEVAPAPKPKKPRKKRPPITNQLVPFKCTPCTEESGVDQTLLVQVIATPHEANGKLVAGHLWWACDTGIMDEPMHRATAVACRPPRRNEPGARPFGLY